MLLITHAWCQHAFAVLFKLPFPTFLHRWKVQVPHSRPHAQFWVVQCFSLTLCILIHQGHTPHHPSMTDHYGPPSTLVHCNILVSASLPLIMPCQTLCHSTQQFSFFIVFSYSLLLTLIFMLFLSFSVRSIPSSHLLTLTPSACSILLLRSTPCLSFYLYRSFIHLKFTLTSLSVDVTILPYHFFVT